MNTLSSKISIIFSVISIFLIAALIYYGLSSASGNDKYGLGGAMIAGLWLIAYLINVIVFIRYRYRVKHEHLQPSSLTTKLFKIASLGIVAFFIVGWISESLS